MTRWGAATGAILAMAFIALHAAPARATGNAEVTIIPQGKIGIPQGNETRPVPLPRGADGVLDLPLVLLAAQPWQSLGPGELASEAQVPGVLQIRLGDVSLPDWVLEPFPTAFVINIETLRSAPTYADGYVELTFDFQTEAAGVNASVLGVPDLQVLGVTGNGPLAELVRAEADPQVQRYLDALYMEIGGDLTRSREIYQSLADSDNAALARLARRGLRMMTYLLRPYRITGNVLENFRWGLYLQQCGFYAPGYEAYDEARIIAPEFLDAQYRAADCFERISLSPLRVLNYFERVVGQASYDNATDWYVLVLFIKERDGRILTDEEIRNAKTSWLWAEIALQAAAQGRLRTITTFQDVADTSLVAGPGRLTRLPTPHDEIIEERGWFDAVFCVWPRLDDEPETDFYIDGGDVGPKGAAVAHVFADTAHDVFVQAFYAVLRWAALNADLADSMPPVEQTVRCGWQPIPNRGYGTRAALRYHVPPDHLRRLKITTQADPQTFLRLWRLQGPVTLPAQGASTNGPLRVADAWPPDAEVESRAIETEKNWIDLARVWPDSGAAVARATCWVFCPQDREVRMWLGRNDAAAVSINGNMLFRDRRFAANRHADQDLPDTVATYTPLKRGWNEIAVTVQRRAAPDDAGWGFSLRLCGWDGAPIPGLAFLNAPPANDRAPAYQPPDVGAHYDWHAVHHDWLVQLPRLDETALRTITAEKDLQWLGDLTAPNGYAALIVPGRAASPIYRPLADAWNGERDRDFVLNNVLDDARESCLALRYTRDGGPRDLMLIKPESVEAFLTLMKESPRAHDAFGTTPAQRVLGYVRRPAGDGYRCLIAVDVLLPDAPDRPAGEDDLLAPMTDRPPSMVPPVGPTPSG